jgi:ATP-dependent DNA helicase RecQ
MPARLRALLKQVFGYDEFRPLQGEIMEATLAGRDAVAILPTGAGKSLCYQLPALVREGLTVVISPLIALMKDQVDQLEAAGVAATFLNSTLDRPEIRDREQRLLRGEFKLLYVAPERLMMPGFLQRLREWRMAALAVDEAHCISEWGHDFRPDYRQLAAVRANFPEVPTLALTATATPRVRDDIATQLHLREPEFFIASFNRPNLSYRVIPKARAERQVWEFASARQGESGIVYCLARKSTEALAAALREEGLAAVAYHAGLEAVERSRNQEAFLRDEAKIVCATIAFGMGINKPNVRYVIHADLPKNVESYYQETGRAGRDGLPADCLLLYSPGDRMKLLRFIEEMTDDAARAVALHQLDEMVAYGEEADCRRAALLRYFGETFPDDNCGGCDNCLEPRETWDATLDAQKFLSCLFRIRERSGFSVGMQHVADVLAGGDTAKIRRFEHHTLSTWGVGKEKPRAEWVALGQQLVRLGLARLGEHSVVEITAEGLAALKRRTGITLTRPPSIAAKDKPAATAIAAARAGEIPCDEALFEMLRELRKELADARGVPPYVVFSDVTLRHMARSYPQSDAALLAVPGVGERKLLDFGAAFLAAITAWLAEHPRQTFGALAPAYSPARPMRIEMGINGTALETLRQWREGRTVGQIALQRSLSVGTVEGHLAQAIEAGEALDPRAFYTAAEEAEMRAALIGHESPALKPVFDKLSGRISYGKWRIYRAFAARAGVVPPR